MGQTCLLSPEPAASCVREASGHMLQTRWAAGHAASYVRCGQESNMVDLPSVRHGQFEQFTPARTRALLHTNIPR